MIRKLNKTSCALMVLTAITYSTVYSVAQSVEQEPPTNASKSTLLVEDFVPAALKVPAVTSKPPTHLGVKGQTFSIDLPFLGDGDVGAAISGKPEAQRLFLGKSDFFWLKSTGGKYYGMKGFGTLDILIPALVGAKYHIEQRLDKAETLSTFTGAKGTVQMKTITPYGSSLIVVELSTDKPVDVSLKLTRIEGQEQIVLAGRTDGTSWIRGGYDEKSADIPVDLTCAMAVRGADADTFQLRPGKPVTVVMSMRSNFDSKTPHEEALQRAKTTDLSAAYKKHVAFWSDYWSKSFVEVGDPQVEKQYYYSYYILGCCTGNPEFPPGLWGPWMVTENAAWYGSYHYNYNFEAALWHLYSGNRIAQTDGYDNPPLAAMEQCREFAQKYLKCRGIYFPVATGPKGLVWAADRGQWAFFGQKSNAGYILGNMSMRWDLTRDLDYAKKVYPFVLGVVDFWEDYLKFENGKYNSHNDCINEGSPNQTNPIISLAFIQNAMRTAIDMSEALNVDANRRAKWQHIHDHIVYPTQPFGKKTIFRLTEKGMGWWKSNSCGTQPIFPAGAFGLDSDPKWFAIAKETATCSPRWFNGNGSCSYFPAAARVGYDPEVLFAKLREFSDRAWSNGLVSLRSGGLENCSTVPNTINEMLLQGHQNVLRVFPVWPQDRDARFGTLRAKGAFLVSSRLINGRVSAVEIRSEKGRDCVIVNPWPDEETQVFRNGKIAEIISGDRFTLKTAANEVLLLGPKGASINDLIKNFTLPLASPITLLHHNEPVEMLDVVEGPKDITFETEEETEIYYTLDGSTPSAQSPRYLKSLQLTDDGMLKTLARQAGRADRHNEFWIKGYESGQRLINTLSSDHDASRLKVSSVYEPEAPCYFDQIAPDRRPVQPGKRGIFRFALLPDISKSALIERFVKIPPANTHPKLQLVASADHKAPESFCSIAVGISVDGAETEWLETKKVARTDGWKSMTVDLTKYAGQSARITLKVTAGLLGANRFYFDEISVISNLSK